MKRIGKPLRQGDVCLQPIDKLPANVRTLQKDVDHLVLALGEQTGHRHLVRAQGLCSFTTLDGEDIEFLLVPVGGGKFLHEKPGGAQADHDPHDLLPGYYELPVQVEDGPEQAPRVVAD